MVQVHAAQGDLANLERADAALLHGALSWKIHQQGFVMMCNRWSAEFPASPVAYPGMA
jgi:hypothetical protein